MGSVPKISALYRQARAHRHKTATRFLHFQRSRALPDPGNPQDSMGNLDQEIGVQTVYPQKGGVRFQPFSDLLRRSRTCLSCGTNRTLEKARPKTDTRRFREPSFFPRKLEPNTKTNRSQRNCLKNLRISSTKIPGCSNAAKWPPLVCFSQ